MTARGSKKEKRFQYHLLSLSCFNPPVAAFNVFEISSDVNLATGKMFGDNRRLVILIGKVPVYRAEGSVSIPGFINTGF